MRTTSFHKLENKHNKKVVFIRVESKNINKTLQEIILKLHDLSWIEKFDQGFKKASLYARVKPTVDSIEKKLKLSIDDEITKDAGEYIVSELSRLAIENELNYNCPPLSELYSKQVSGNAGFDYHAKSEDNILIFGEAKYLTGRNAYGTGLKQVVSFIAEKKDIKDINDLEDFFDVVTLNNAVLGKKGYAVGFSSQSTNTKTLINNIKKNKEYNELLKYDEIVLIAVDI